MKKKVDVQERFDEKLIEKLEKTKFWENAIKNVDRFDDPEKDFFLNEIRRHYCLKERIVARWYTDIVAALAKNYQPAEVAKIWRLTFFINKFELQKKSDLLKRIIPNRRVVISKK